MERPISPKEFIEQHQGEIDLWDFSIKLISIVEAFRHYKSQQCCAICDGELSEEEINEMKPIVFNLVCTKHKSYAMMYNVIKIREHLGFSPYKNYFE